MAEQNEENPKPDLRYRYMNKALFLVALRRVFDVRRERLLLTPDESTIADEITAKIAAASRAYLITTEGVSPTGYLRRTSSDRRSRARGFAIAAVLVWRDSERGLRPDTLHVICKELGEVVAGITSEEIEVRDAEREVARLDREVSALEAEQKRAAGWRDFVQQLTSPSAS